MENPFMIYMKGHPDAPHCGFNALAVKVLQQYGVSITARDILESSEIKDAVKSFTLILLILTCNLCPIIHKQLANVSTNIYQGEFIDGSDIILKMHQNGELKLLLQDIVDNNGKE